MTYKFKNISDLAKEKSASFYANGILTESCFKGLDQFEKKEVLINSALSEFVNLKDVMKDFYSKKMADAERDFTNMTSQNSRFFKDVTKSAGDFTKSEQYRNIQSLLSYSIEANDSNGKGINGRASEGQEAYDTAAMVIRNAIKNLVSKSSAFKQAITREAILPLEKRYAFSTYLVLCYLIYSTTDVLYSSSLKANFDHNQKTPIATDIYFEYNGGMENQLQYLTYFSENMSKGGINKLLSGVLTENFDNAAESVVLGENVLDVVAKLVLDSWVSDVVLLPIYLLRQMVYIFKFVKTYFVNMAVDIEESIALQRSAHLSKVDYDSYKSKADNKLFAVSQAVSKAEASIELEASADKKILNNIKSSNNNVLI